VGLVHDAQDLNRLVCTIDALGPRAMPVHRKALLEAFRGAVFGGRFADLESTLDLATKSGLVVALDGQRFALGVAGRRLLSLNPVRYYETRDEQRRLLFHVLVQAGPLTRTAAILFSRLKRGAGDPPELVIDGHLLASLPREGTKCFGVLRFLGVFSGGPETWLVTPSWLDVVGAMRKRGTTTEAELSAMLAEQKALGRAAEELTVQYERRRLRRSGAVTEGDLVRRISEVDVGAGYDVESFRGKSKDFIPNRHIEVKASSGQAVRFFWTRNEYETSKRLGDSYWIYFVGAFRPSAGLAGFRPKRFRNPASLFEGMPQIKVEPAVFLVSEERGGLSIIGATGEAP
jgi:hypothetical protein